MSGGKLFLIIIVLAIGITTVWGIQFYNFYAFKTNLLDEQLPRFLNNIHKIDDEEIQIAQRRIIEHSTTEGYTIDVDDIRFLAKRPGSPEMSYEVYQITSDYVLKTQLTVEITYTRKVLFFEKTELVTYEKEL